MAVVVLGVMGAFKVKVSSIGTDSLLFENREIGRAHV